MDVGPDPRDTKLTLIFASPFPNEGPHRLKYLRHAVSHAPRRTFSRTSMNSVSVWRKTCAERHDGFMEPDFVISILGMPEAYLCQFSDLEVAFRPAAQRISVSLARRKDHGEGASKPGVRFEDIGRYAVLQSATFVQQGSLRFAIRASECHGFSDERNLARARAGPHKRRVTCDSQC